jgi:hypothetical protein
MVQAMINIAEKTNRVLNIVKAKYGLKDKSRAIEFVIADYEANRLEPELRPEYIEKVDKIEKDSNFTHYSSLSDLRKEIEDV